MRLLRDPARHILAQLSKGLIMPGGKRIVLTTFGSYGDIHPYMALAMELQERGHHPVIATSELYREKMQAAGFDFVAVRPNLPPPQEQDPELMAKIMEPKTGSRFLMDEVLFPFVREGYDDLFQAVQRADLLLTHPITLAGPLVAQKTGIPWVSSVLAPVSFFSAYDPPVPPFWPWMRHVQVFGPRFLAAFFHQIKRIYRNEPYNQFRAELGLPDRGSPIFRRTAFTDIVLALFSKLFAQAQPDWPSQARITGFAFYDGRRELEMPGELSRFLDAGPAPIVFTLGSSAVWVAQDFYHQSIAAAKALGRRAVLLVGDDRNHPVEPLSPEVIAVNYAPYEALLPRACAMVHHGGVGARAGIARRCANTDRALCLRPARQRCACSKTGTSRTLAPAKYRAPRVAKELRPLIRSPLLEPSASGW